MVKGRRPREGYYPTHLCYTPLRGCVAAVAGLPGVFQAFPASEKVPCERVTGAVLPIYFLVVAAAPFGSTRAEAVVVAEYRDRTAFADPLKASVFAAGVNPNFAPRVVGVFGQRFNLRRSEAHEALRDIVERELTAERGPC